MHNMLLLDKGANVEITTGKPEVENHSVENRSKDPRA